MPALLCSLQILPGGLSNVAVAIASLAAVSEALQRIVILSMQDILLIVSASMDAPCRQWPALR